MKISIITVSYNSSATIRDSINSILAQDHPDIEYIVVDGNSTDNTLEIVKSFGHQIKWISEPDNGIYDAMNKGLKIATGDVVGILNSDDFYSTNQIVSQVAAEFSDPSIDVVFGDLVFVDPQNLNKTVRKYSSAKWNPDRFAWGFMPAHPSVFIRGKYYEQFGLFKTDYKIAADYELLIRFLYVHKLKYRYLPHTMVKMRTGGVSSKNLMSNVVLNNEIIRACHENGINTNVMKVYSKYVTKIFELVTSK